MINKLKTVFKVMSEGRYFSHHDNTGEFLQQTSDRLVRKQMQQQSGKSDQKLLKKQESSVNPSETRTKSRLEIAEDIRMKRRTLSGTCGVGVFAIAFIAIALAFATPR